MQIQGRTIDISKHYLEPVTYVPNHAKGNANHSDSERGVIIRRSEKYVFILNCKSRTVQAANPENLVWG